MDALLAICMVVGTLAITTIAVMMIRVVRHFDSATDELRRTAEAARSSLAGAQQASRQLVDLADGLRDVAPPLRRSAAAVEELTGRVMEMSHSVLDEVYRPLDTTISLIHGLRAGTRSLVGALTHRRNGLHANKEGGHE